ncbi:lysoplasmalogenase family protein [Candidatus Halocynthiibacter alkanivorans]|uniref:lysoplasmalogenase family protein n=1 Tax=Candidatus Halocynthiibacter alkanivorans TaxID=2267619 RepID=UPI000DF3CEF2|nr:lysoplasmalogenase [Candidatus Halocynthiibacter alkanivorans]
MDAALWSLAAGFALWYFFQSNGAASLLRSLVKTVPLLVLALIAAQGGAPAGLTLAFCASAAGDLCLSRPGQRFFLAGMGSFAAAHVAFISVFLATSGLTLWGSAADQPVLTVALIVLLLSTEFWLAPFAGDLKLPLRAYALVIGAMALAAGGLPQGADPARIGVAMFVLSDLLIAVQMFRLNPPGWRFRATGYALWSLYFMGQALILTAFV